ncbi:MAG TPA: lipid II flippase MurJ [candidate division Zixibacteria bacterium]|nr:lipid II flippase MurJ [candidate division Zixibacteria bacterium]
MTGGSMQRAVFGVAGVLLLSRVFGFVREMVIAHRFGTSADYDLYLIAIMFSALAYGILNYAGYYLFVPYLTRRLQARAGAEGPPDFWPLVNTGAAAALAVTLLLAAAGPALLRLWAVDYVGEGFDRIAFYSRVTAVVVVLGVAEAFMRAFLNVKRVYTHPAAGYIVFNLFSILSIVLLAGRLGVGAIALGWIGGLLAQNVWLAARLVRVHAFGGYRPQMITEETKYLIATASALIVIELINRSYFLIDRYFAPQFGPGVISALNYSQVIVQLPDSIIGWALGAVVFPMFSAHRGEADRAKFWFLYRRTVTAALVIAVPIAAALFITAPEVIYVLLQRGEFDPQSTATTAAVLRPYVPSLIALFIVSTSIRACYSGGWVRAVFWVTVSVFAVKAAATWGLSALFGPGGISAATSAAEVVFAVLLLGIAVRRIAGEGRAAFLGVLGRILAAGAAAAALAGLGQQLLPEWAAAGGRGPALIKIVLSGLAVAALYVLFGRLLGLRRQFADVLALRTQRAGEA